MNYTPQPPPLDNPITEYLYRELQKLSAAYNDNAPTVLFLTRPATAGTLSAGVSANWKLPACNILRISASATLTLTGLGMKEPNRLQGLINIGTAAIVLPSENAGSSASYRFALPSTWQLSANCAALLWYDPFSSRWRGISKTS